MFTDIVGFTALGQQNETLSLELLDEQRAMLRPIFQRHGGKEVKSLGDGFLVDFTNALDAVRCAYDIQRASREANYSRSPERRVLLRVGVHLGDVVEAGGDISGDAVNVASRIESLSEAGGVCITRQVFDQVQNKFELGMTSLGARNLKNLRAPLEVFKLMMPWGEGSGSGAPEVDRNRIAILPFANLSPSPGDEYFADGLTDEIISTVSGITGLSVISRTSVMRYKQTTKSMTEIGRELKAGMLLEGSVRKAGNRVRITVQLIDSERDEHLWARSYDGTLDDVFETQADVAQKIAEALRLPTPPALGRTEKSEVRTLCLRARTLWNKRTRQANEQAMLLFEDALRVDPESARALAGLAQCYADADNGSMDAKDATSKAMSLARRAIELDANLPDAYIALGSTLMGHNWSAAEVQLKKALSLNPSHADAHEWYARILRGHGRIEEALEEARRAYELDPLPPGRAFQLGSLYYFVGRNDEALALCNRLIQAEPEYIWGYYGRAVLSAIKGDREQAYQDLEAFRKLTDELNYQGFKARIEAHLGDKEAATRLVDETESLLAEDHSARAVSVRVHLLCACANTGDSDRFFRLAAYVVDRKAFEPGELMGPDCQKMSGDPRFANLVQKLRASYGLSN